MWTVSNVGKEVLKLVPSFADRNATSSPIFVSWMVGFVATGKHVYPDVIERLSFASPRIAVLISRSVVAARFSSLQCVQANNGFSTAIAKTVPVLSASKIRFSGWSNGYALAKTLARDILKVAHITALLGLREVARLALTAPPRCAV